MFYIHTAPLGLMRIMRKTVGVGVPNPLGEETSPLRLGNLSANYGLASHQCQRALATEVILLLFRLHVYFFRDSERKNAPRKIPL